VFGFAGCIVALIGECITVSLYNRTGNSSIAAAAVFFLFLHITWSVFLRMHLHAMEQSITNPAIPSSFSLSVDATSYIYASEIFPTPVRAKGLSVSVSGLFVATIIFLQCAPTAFENIGWKYYLVFIVITAILFVAVWLYFPEVSAAFRTRERSGKSLTFFLLDTPEIS
jgi:hypothetical protein